MEKDFSESDASMRRLQALSLMRLALSYLEEAGTSDATSSLRGAADTLETEIARERNLSAMRH